MAKFSTIHGNDIHVIQYLTFKNAFTVTPQFKESTWGEFKQLLMKPQVYRFQSLANGKEDIKANTEQKKLGPGFSFAILKEHGIRRNADVLELAGMNLDLECAKGQKTHPTLELIQQQLAGIEYFVYTTNQHVPGKARYRVVIWFARSVSVAEYQIIYCYFYSKFGKLLDSVVKGVSTMAFFPRVPDSRLPYFEYYEGRGEFFDPAPVLAESHKYAVYKEPKKASSKKHEADDEPIFRVVPVIDIDQLSTTPFLRQMIETGAPELIGIGKSRSELVYAVVKRLIRENQGITNDQLAGVLLNRDYKISQRHLEKASSEDYVFKDIKRIRTVRETLIKGVEPHTKLPKYLSLSEAQAKLTNHIDSFFAHLYLALGLKASAGLGKTFTVACAIAQLKRGQGLVEIYVPNHRLAQELEKLLKLRAPHLRIDVIAGRTHEYQDGTFPCARSELVKELSTRQIPIYQNLCKNKEAECPHFGNCRFLAQFHVDSDVRIMPHSYLAFPRTLLDQRQPDCAVIDESFFNEMISIRQYSFSSLQASSINSSLRCPIQSALEQNEPLFEYLEKEFDNVLDELKSELKEITKLGAQKLKGLSIKPDMPDSSIKSELSLVKTYTFEKQLLSALIEEYEWLQRNTVEDNRKGHSVTVRKVDKEDFVICRRKPLSRFTFKQENGETVNVPVLCLDADLDKSVVSRFLPNIVVKRIEAERNANIIQVYNTRNSKSRFLKDKASKLVPPDNEKARRAIIKIVKQCDKLAGNRGMLVVIYKKFRGAKSVAKKRERKTGFTTETTVAGLHFGNVRGYDIYNGFEYCVIIGRHQAPVSAYENKAAALWWDDAKLLNLCGSLIEQPRGYHLRNGDKYGVMTVVHPDHRVQRLVELMREAETLQAIDRLRMIRAETRKNAYILSNLPLPITVDKLVTLQELAQLENRNLIELLISEYDGVVPLSAEYLQKHHSRMFSSLSNIKRIVASFQDRHFKKEGQKYLSDERYYTLKRYCTDSTRSKSSKPCLVDREFSDNKALKILQKLYGDTVTVSWAKK
jgi:hypothetical protein